MRTPDEVRPLPRVLIADDTDDVRELLRFILETSGAFEVVAEARDGREAVALAAVHRPDLVLLDLAMPVMDGLQALPQIIRESPVSKVVVVSGFSAGRLGSEVVQLGAWAYLEKGIAPKEIVRRLTEIAEQHAPTFA